MRCLETIVEKDTSIDEMEICADMMKEDGANFLSCLEELFLGKILAKPSLIFVTMTCLRIQEQFLLIYLIFYYLLPRVAMSENCHRIPIYLK